jgi:hypothetical protein
MYRKWKKIDLYLFGAVQRFTGNRNVFVWGYTGNGTKKNFIGLE